MSDEQIKYLKNCLTAPAVMCWYRDGFRLRKIVSIGSNPDEPGPVAYVGSGEYAALWACETSDFFITTNDLAVWPE